MFIISYCLNPQCQKPRNPDGTKFCQSCRSRLLLRMDYSPSVYPFAGYYP
ncbi:4-Cys prefix domain-containing protein [Microseira wollei]